MNIVLYKFAKRNNSTKRPTASDQSLAVTGIVLNDSASSVTQFKLSVPDVKQNVTRHLNRYNYCYIPDFARYYWINDWRYTNSGIWVADMIVDPLASWKEFISTGTGYISRTGNVTLVTDEYIPDNMYNGIAQYTTDSESLTMGHFTADPKGGCFVIGTVVTSQPEYGAVNYYLITLSQMNILVQNMVTTTAGVVPTDPNAWKTTSLGSDVLKSLASPMQYVVSCKWFPFHSPTDGPLTDIYLGQWATGAQGVKLVGDSSSSLNPFSGNNNDVYTYHNIDIPKIYPTTEGYGRIAQYPPFAKYTFISPTFGNVDLDPNVCCSRDNIIIDIVTNLITGQARTTLSYFGNPSDTAQSQNLQILSQNVVSLGIDINLSQVSTNYLDMAKATVDTAGNVVGAFLSPWNAANSVTNAVKSGLDAVAYAMSPNMSGNGVAGGTFWFDIDTVTIQAQFQHTTEKYPAEFGMPYNKVEQIGLHTGYFVQCTDFDPAIDFVFTQAILKNEHDVILQNLKEGVFLE